MRAEQSGHLALSTINLTVPGSTVIIECTALSLVRMIMLGASSQVTACFGFRVFSEYTLHLSDDI